MLNLYLKKVVVQFYILIPVPYLANMHELVHVYGHHRFHLTGRWIVNFSASGSPVDGWFTGS